jgi:hypothetical protein
MARFGAPIGRFIALNPRDGAEVAFPELRQQAKKSTGLKTGHYNGAAGLTGTLGIRYNGVRV